MSTEIHDVVIAGAGPNGLMLACELSLAGIRPFVLERLPGPSTELRANGLVGQVVRMLDRRGLYERLSGSAQPPNPAPGFVFGALPLDLSKLEDNPLHLLPVPQPRIVAVLAELTRTGRPLLLDLTADRPVASATAVASWRDRLDVVAARPQEPGVPATALLLRPDCYVAWASAAPRPGVAELADAVEKWFGMREPAAA